MHDKLIKLIFQSYFCNIQLGSSSWTWWRKRRWWASKI